MNSQVIGEEMLQWAKDLFPYCRSITGDGTRQTLAYFQNINPELELITFKTGEKVFDWDIPKEWNIVDAYLEHESGKRFAEFKKNNLHVLNYASPIDQVFKLEDLSDHIYTSPKQPDLIPYVTSYYSERWGFCMSHEEKCNMPKGNYRAFIDSTLEDGTLNLTHAVIEGTSSQEIFFSSYVCHPSMANNELSGPVLLSALMRYVKQQYPEPKFSYRFVLLPETIGSIAYLSRHHQTLKSNVYCGFNLSCVGDERAYSHVQSRFGNSLADKALQAALRGRENVKTYTFLDRASDECRYCAPGIDLPLCTFCRSKFGEYPEYHTNADNFDVVTAKGLAGSFEVMKNIIDVFEMGEYPKVRVLCEPQLGKRGLYPTLSRVGSAAGVKARMDFLAYADGTTSIFEMSKIIDRPLDVILDEYRILSDAELVESGRSSPA
jgi:aminopeptidase-like protein